MNIIFVSNDVRLANSVAWQFKKFLNENKIYRFKNGSIYTTKHKTKADTVLEISSAYYHYITRKEFELKHSKQEFQSIWQIINNHGNNNTIDFFAVLLENKELILPLPVTVANEWLDNNSSDFLVYIVNGEAVSKELDYNKIHMLIDHRFLSSEFQFLGRELNLIDC